MEVIKNPSFQSLDRGKRFCAYTNGEQVIKISTKHYSRNEALEKTAGLASFYDLLRTYLANYVATSEFSTPALENGLYAVRIDQPFVTGQDWQGVLRSLKDSYEYRFIIDFLQRCLSMQEQTGHIPELYGPIKRPDKINQLTETRNIKIAYKDDAYFPVLVDTGPNRFSATQYGTRFHNKLLGNSIKERLALSLRQ